MQSLIWLHFCYFIIFNSSNNSFSKSFIYVSIFLFCIELKAILIHIKAKNIKIKITSTPRFYLIYLTEVPNNIQLYLHN